MGRGDRIDSREIQAKWLNKHLIGILMRGGRRTGTSGSMALASYEQKSAQAMVARAMVAMGARAMGAQHESLQQVI